MATIASVTNADVLAFFNKFKPLTRNLAVGQLAYTYVNRHGGTTTVPKYGCWVTIVSIHDSYVKVRSLGRPGSNFYTIGSTYLAAKNVIKRIDPQMLMNLEITAVVDGITRSSPEYEALSQETRGHYQLFRNLLKAWSDNPLQYLNQWRNQIYGSSSNKLVTDLLRGENRQTFKHWSFDSNRSQYNALFRTHIRDDLKKLGVRYAARLALVAKIDSVAKAIETYNYLQQVHNEVSNRFRFTSNKERALLSELMESITSFDATYRITFAGCGHAAASDSITSVHGSGTYCPACLTRYTNAYGELVDAITRDGQVVRAARGNTHTWEDGSVRTYGEPPVIGGYHSNKDTFKKSLPHITGKMPHEHTLKVGYELEFCRGKAPKNGDEWFARDMLKKVKNTFDLLKDQPYCAFERDGSVDFEMVSGYGPMDIHRAGVSALLQGNPYHGQLQSHDGGRCGLHVHLDKPTSLMHATRLTAFWNNPFNERLIRAVARRYGKNTGFAKFKGAAGDMAQSAKVYKQSVSYYGKQDALRRAINSLSTERYDVCNFTNTRTVEIRAFRGSMLVDTVIACLEFAYMSWYFSRDTTADQLTTDNFLAYISKTEWRHETRYIRKFLWNRGFKVWMPKKQPRVHTVEA